MKTPIVGGLAFVCLLVALFIISVELLPFSCTRTSRLSANPSVGYLYFKAGNCECFLSSFHLLHDVPNVNCSCPDQIQKDCPPSEVKIIEKQPIYQETVKEIIKEPCPEAKPTVQNVVKYEPWWAEDRVWHYPMKFPRCSMDSCFNFSRCDNMEDMLIYSYDVPSPPVRYFTSINSTKWHTDDPNKACLFFVYLDLNSPWRTHPRDLPYWNGGLNHVLITFADQWKQRGPPEDQIDLASVMATDVHETTYRAGFDISISLPPNVRLPYLQSLKPFERKYFLTFRGLRYVGNREGSFRSFNTFRAMHNGNDIIVATSCNHANTQSMIRENSTLGAFCEEDQLIHSNHSYHDLMNTTFGLVPAGIQPNSYRFLEVLSSGTIPVLIADNYVKPLDNLVQWYKCLIQFPTREMGRIVGTLRAISREEVESRQVECLQIYDKFFSSNELMLESPIKALKARFMGAIAAFSAP